MDRRQLVTHRRNCANYVAICDFHKNNLGHFCYKPTTHCNKSSDPTRLVEMLYLHCKLTMIFTNLIITENENPDHCKTEK